MHTAQSASVHLRNSSSIQICSNKAMLVRDVTRRFIINNDFPRHRLRLQ